MSLNRTLNIITMDCPLAGSGYAVFAGREVSRALGLMSLEEEDCCGELADLTPRQLEILEEWTAKFREKYTVVGKARVLKRFREKNFNSKNVFSLNAV